MNKYLRWALSAYSWRVKDFQAFWWLLNDTNFPKIGATTDY